MFEYKARPPSGIRTSHVDSQTLAAPRDIDGPFYEEEICPAHGR